MRQLLRNEGNRGSSLQLPSVLYKEGTGTMGFKKVDGFAIKLNPGIAESVMRIKSCITYILEMQENDNGNSFICDLSVKYLKSKSELSYA